MTPIWVVFNPCSVVATTDFCDRLKNTVQRKEPPPRGEAWRGYIKLIYVVYGAHFAKNLCDCKGTKKIDICKYMPTFFERKR